MEKIQIITYQVGELNNYKTIADVNADGTVDKKDSTTIISIINYKL